MRRKLLSLLAAGLALGLVGCDIDDIDFSSGGRHKEDFHYTYPLKPGGRVSLENFNGSVEVSGWEKDEVEINGTKYAGRQELLVAMKIDIVASTDAVRIRTVRPSERRGNMGAKYILRVPRRTELERIVSSNGGIRVEGIEGTARLKTSNGSVRVWKVQGDLEATSSNGGLDLQDFRGSAVLRTSNGGIKADGVRGHFAASTSNGGIHARLLDLSPQRPVKVESSNGNVDLTLESLQSTEVYASTSNASVTVRLPGSVSAQVRAHTSNSSITSDFDVAVQGLQSKSRLEGKIGIGGPLLDLSTSNGSIKLLRL